jgi:hypothetical protein
MQRRTELIDERGTRPDKPMKPGRWPSHRGFGKRRCGGAAPNIDHVVLGEEHLRRISAYELIF